MKNGVSTKTSPLKPSAGSSKSMKVSPMSMSCKSTKHNALIIEVSFRLKWYKLIIITTYLQDVTESLLNACKNGDITIVHTLLLDPNTVINGQDEEVCLFHKLSCFFDTSQIIHLQLENSALHYACSHGHDEIVDLLLVSGAMVDVENEVRILFYQLK
jgi:ankyrin repeat protein